MTDFRHFMGRGGFVWWMGVVESRQDELNLGRLKVRIIGWHDDQPGLPTEDLPWAHPSLPLNHPTPYSPPEGTQVWGFFQDGELGQLPIVVGVLPTIPAKPS